MPRTQRIAALLALAGLATTVACSDDGTATDDGVSTENGDGDGDGDDAGDNSGDGDGDDGMPTDLPQEDLGFDGVPAGGGIGIARVEFNQGVGVDVTTNGQWLGPGDRLAPLAEGREAVVRVFWDIPTDWQPREIEARLHLRAPDGTQLVRTFTKFIDGPPNPDDLANGSLGFFLEPEEMVGGMDFQISLWEVDGSSVTGDQFVTAAEGWNPLGVEIAPLEIKVVIVPIKVTEAANGCNSDTSDITDEQIEGFATWLDDFNPTQKVTVRKRETFERVGAISAPNNFFSVLQVLRLRDGADPNEYYYAIYNDCGAGGGTAGAAPGAQNVYPTKEAAAGRVAAGRWNGNNPSGGYSVFVHEIGHTQGRPHAPCGGPDGVDPGYPYPGAVIGVYGINTRTFTLYGPNTARDYMSYCGPEWVSDYTWRKVFGQIRALTAWDYESRAEAWTPTGHTLQAQLYADGTQEWWTMPGNFAAPQTGEDLLRVQTTDGEQLLLPASVRESADNPDVRYVTVDLPAELDGGLDDLEHFELVTQGVEIVPASGSIAHDLSY